MRRNMGKMALARQGRSRPSPAQKLYNCVTPIRINFPFPCPPGATPARRVGSFGGYPFVMIFLAGVISTQPGRKETKLLPMELRPWTKTARSRNPAGSRRPSKPPGPASRFLSERAAASSIETRVGHCRPVGRLLVRLRDASFPRNENEPFCELRRNETEQSSLPIFTRLCRLWSTSGNQTTIILIFIYI